MKNSCESIKRFQKNNIVNSQTIKILFQAYYFPGFSGYSAGGSEKALLRLTRAIKEKHPYEYSILIYVMHKKLSGVDLPLPKEIPVIGNPSKLSILPFLFKQQKYFDILHIFSFNRFPNKLLILLPLFWRKPVIIRINSSAVLENSKKYSSAIRHFIFNHITKFIAVSPEIVTLLKQIDVEPEKIELIPNGIDTNFFKPLTLQQKTKLRLELFRGKLKKNRLVFIYSGRITEQYKKIKTFLEIWKNSSLSVNGNKLVLVGPLLEKNKDDRQKIKDYLMQGNKYNIFWTGAKSEDEILKYLQASDIFVLPSVTEGFSNSLLEAMSCGLIPLVRNGVSGNSIVKNNLNGYQFVDDEDLALLIKQVSCNRHRFHKLSHKARDMVVKNFEITNIVNKYHDLYTSIVK